MMLAGITSQAGWNDVILFCLVFSIRFVVLSECA